MSGVDALVDYPGQRRGQVELNDRVDNDAGRHDGAGSRVSRPFNLDHSPRRHVSNACLRRMPPTPPHRK
jgi:hypothetical protein